MDFSEAVVNSETTDGLYRSLSAVLPFRGRGKNNRWTPNLVSIVALNKRELPSSVVETTARGARPSVAVSSCPTAVVDPLFGRTT